MKNTTVGLSPKARDAGLITAVATLVALAIQWAITGEFDRAELVTTLTGLGSALVAFLAAYRADPGTIQRVPTTTTARRADHGRRVRRPALPPRRPRPRRDHRVGPAPGPRLTP
jgi:hypothetical protein